MGSGCPVMSLHVPIGASAALRRVGRARHVIVWSLVSILYRSVALLLTGRSNLSSFISSRSTYIVISLQPRLALGKSRTRSQPLPPALSVSRLHSRVASRLILTYCSMYGVCSRGCRLDSARGVARPEPARPNRAPQRTPSARGGMASSLRSKPASAAATRSHQRAARHLDMPSVSNAQSAHQGRDRDNRSRRAHSSLTEWSDTGTQVRPPAPWDRGVSSRMLSYVSCACRVSMCVCLCRPTFPSSRSRPGTRQSDPTLSGLPVAFPLGG